MPRTLIVVLIACCQLGAPDVTADIKTGSRPNIILLITDQHAATALGLVGRMVRTKKYKYCVYDVGQRREQLFDMEADPGETNNLAVDANYIDQLNKHRTLITAWAQQTSDNSFPYVSARSE